jgi:hypothetical protein
VFTNRDEFNPKPLLPKLEFIMTHKFLRIDPATGKILADSPGPISDNSDGARFDWVLAN